MIKFEDLYKKKLFKYGLPFLVMVIGGSFGLKEFTQLRFYLEFYFSFYFKKHLLNLFHHFLDINLVRRQQYVMMN